MSFDGKTPTDWIGQIHQAKKADPPGQLHRVSWLSALLEGLATQFGPAASSVIGNSCRGARKIPLMHPEDAVDIVLVPHAYLDVSLAAKSRVGVDVFSFCENSANGIEGFVSGTFACEMEEVDDGAVEFTETKIVAANIFRHLRAGGGDDRLKTCVGLFHGMNAIGADEVQTESGVDHCADHEWLDFPTFVFQDSICALPSPFKGSVRV